MTTRYSISVRDIQRAGEKIEELRPVIASINSTVKRLRNEISVNNDSSFTVDERRSELANIQLVEDLNLAISTLAEAVSLIAPICMRLHEEHNDNLNELAGEIRAKKARVLKWSNFGQWQKMLIYIASAITIVGGAVTQIPGETGKTERVNKK